MKYSLEDFLKLKASFKKNRKVKILSGSMEPFIYKNDVVTIANKSVKLLKKGDVIVFWKDNKLICHLFHRFNIFENKECLITKGINSKRYDSPVLQKFYLGIIIEPKVTKLKKVLFKLYLLLIR